MALGLIVKPGVGVDIGTEVSTAEVVTTSIQDTLVSFVPTNIFGSMANGDMDVYDEKKTVVYEK